MRLKSGALWVHSPVALDAPMRDTLSALGPVRFVVTSNTEHQKWAPDWIRAYPGATGFACPGLREKTSEGGWQRSLSDLLDAPGGLTSAAPPKEWEGEIDLCWPRAQSARAPNFSAPASRRRSGWAMPPSRATATPPCWRWPTRSPQ